jgi:hypothetical protein
MLNNKNSWTANVINFPWISITNLLVILTLSIAFGKVIGGILADRMGWMKTGLLGLFAVAHDPF